MNCRNFEELMLALARNQLLDATAREQGLAHSEVCVRCAARLAEERALLVGVRVVVAELAEQGAPARVEAKLLTAFRQQGKAVASPKVIPMPVKSRYWSSGQRGAIAAGILILISVLAILWQRSSFPDERHQARIITPTPSVTPPPAPKAPVVRRDREMAQQVKAPRPQQHVRYRASGNDLEEAEVVTEFFPLREGEDLAALESARLVRVELPRSALSEVGLSVNPETADASVKADVLLGDDGLARAIRFVR